jgi:hypothetical protein
MDFHERITITAGMTLREFEALIAANLKQPERPFLIVGKGERAQKRVNRFLQKHPDVPRVLLPSRRRASEWICFVGADRLPRNPLFMWLRKDDSWAAPPYFPPTNLPT